MCFSGLYQEFSIYFNKWFFFSSKNTPTPTFFVRCLPCWLVKEGRGRFNAWCERSRGVFVVLEVSTCVEDKGEYGHVFIVGLDVLVLGLPCVSLLSSLYFLFFGPKMKCLDLICLRNSLNQRVYFGGRVTYVPMSGGVQWQRSLHVFWS